MVCQKVAYLVNQNVHDNKIFAKTNKTWQIGQWQTSVPSSFLANQMVPKFFQKQLHPKLQNKLCAHPTSKCTKTQYFHDFVDFFKAIIISLPKIICPYFNKSLIHRQKSA